LPKGVSGAWTLESGLKNIHDKTKGTSYKATTPWNMLKILKSHDQHGRQISNRIVFPPTELFLKLSYIRT